jgi:hypothetical protein
MKPLNLIQNPDYRIQRFKDSTWLRVEYKDEMLGMCYDNETAYQVIYTDLKKNGYNCEKITKKDFE